MSKSDGQKGLKIIFKIGLNSDFWFIWTILENQAEFFLNEFPKLYLAVNNHNVNFWAKKELEVK